MDLYDGAGFALPGIRAMANRRAQWTPPILIFTPPVASLAWSTLGSIVGVRLGARINVHGTVLGLHRYRQNACVDALGSRTALKTHESTLYPAKVKVTAMLEQKNRTLIPSSQGLM